jgi:hypothetical protein
MGGLVDRVSSGVWAVAAGAGVVVAIEEALQRVDLV